jgi:hypothetical protein
VDQADGTPTVLLPIGFTAQDGVRWVVRELGADQPDGIGCLVFESDAMVRRVRTFPSDWRDLDSIGLLALSWKT